MKCRLVLATAPVTISERYGKFRSAASTEPSFGLACLAAAAMEAGANVHIVEAASANMNPSMAAREIIALQPDVVGISATTVGIVAAAELAALLKQSNPQVPVIVGGCHPTSLPEETLSSFPAIDLVVMGEGERTLVDILRSLDQTGSLPAALPGTADRNNGMPRINATRPLIDDLDELPLPAWRALDGFPEAFHPSPARIRRWPCASVVLTRGCPNQCTFCDRSVFGRRCRSYSPARALELVKDLRDNFGVREILLEDDTFIIQKERVREFCNRIIAERVDITWSCLGRADRVDLDLLKLMRRAGCWHISYGIESGDPTILKAVCKNLDLEQMRQAVTWSREAGLKTKGFFMVGFPGESAESLEMTRQLALSLPLHDISVMQLTPFPGSVLYTHAAECGEFERDWKKMNTLNTVFVPRGLTVSTLEQARADILKSFYFRPSVIWEHLLEAIRAPRLLFHQLQGGISLFRVAAK